MNAAIIRQPRVPIQARSSAPQAIHCSILNGFNSSKLLVSQIKLCVIVLPCGLYGIVCIQLGLQDVCERDATPALRAVWMNLTCVFRFVLVFASCTSALVHSEEKAPSGTSSNSASNEGARIFASICASCHGLDGHGGERGPDVAGRRDVQKLSDAALSRVIRKGVSGTGMPSFRHLGNAKIQSVVRHLRWLQGRGVNAALRGSPKAGKTLFFGKAACSECHMVNGAGGFIGSDLSSYARTKSAEQIRQLLTDPNNNLDERGKTVVATTLEGQTFVGIARNEDNFSLQLQTTDGAFHCLEKSSLHRIKHRSESLMPSDYALRLTRQELNDIVSYLISVAREAQSRSPIGKTNTRRMRESSPH